MLLYAKSPRIRSPQTVHFRSMYMIFFENILGNGAVSKLKFLDKVGDPPHKTARRPRLYKPPDTVQLKNALTF